MSLRTKYTDFLKSYLEKMYNRRGLYSYIKRSDFDRFIRWGVKITDFLFNIGIFFSLYIIFIRLMLPRVGFEQTILIVCLVLVMIMRSFLETLKD
jgi:hypothetical protein